MADDDGAQAASASKLAFEAAAGVTYYLAVDGYGVAKGEVVLTLTPSLGVLLPEPVGAEFRIGVIGPVGATVELQSSADLLAWQPVGSNKLPAGVQFFPTNPCQVGIWLLPGTIWDVAVAGENPPRRRFRLTIPTRSAQAKLTLQQEPCNLPKENYVGAHKPPGSCVIALVAFSSLILVIF